MHSETGAADCISILFQFKVILSYRGVSFFFFIWFVEWCGRIVVVCWLLLCFPHFKKKKMSTIYNIFQSRILPALTHISAHSQHFSKHFTRDDVTLCWIMLCSQVKYIYYMEQLYLHLLFEWRHRTQRKPKTMLNCLIRSREFNTIETQKRQCTGRWVVMSFYGWHDSLSDHQLITISGTNTFRYCKFCRICDET